MSSSSFMKMLSSISERSNNNNNNNNNNGGAGTGTGTGTTNDASTSMERQREREPQPSTTNIPASQKNQNGYCSTGNSSTRRVGSFSSFSSLPSLPSYGTTTSATTTATTTARPSRLKQRTSSMDLRKDYSYFTTWWSLRELLKWREYFITVNNFPIWRRHVSWAMDDGHDLITYMTSRYAASMVFLSLLMSAELSVLFNSSAITTEIRHAMKNEAIMTLQFWIGLIILISIIMTLMSLIITFTAWNMVSAISKENAHCILRSSIGQYTGELPHRFIIASVYSSLLWMMLMVFVLMPIGFFSILLTIVVIVLFLHIVTVFSVFGRLILHTTAMSPKPIFDTGFEKSLTPQPLQHQLHIRAMAEIHNSTSITRQYRRHHVPPVDRYYYQKEELADYLNQPLPTTTTTAATARHVTRNNSISSSNQPQYNTTTTATTTTTTEQQETQPLTMNRTRTESQVRFADELFSSSPIKRPSDNPDDNIHYDDNYNNNNNNNTTFAATNTPATIFERSSSSVVSSRTSSPIVGLLGERVSSSSSNNNSKQFRRSNSSSANSLGGASINTVDDGSTMDRSIDNNGPGGILSRNVTGSSTTTTGWDSWLAGGSGSVSGTVVAEITNPLSTPNLSQNNKKNRKTLKNPPPPTALQQQQRQRQQRQSSPTPVLGATAMGRSAATTTSTPPPPTRSITRPSTGTRTLDTPPPPSEVNIRELRAMSIVSALGSGGGGGGGGRTHARISSLDDYDDMNLSQSHSIESLLDMAEDYDDLFDGVPKRQQQIQESFHHQQQQQQQQGRERAGGKDSSRTEELQSLLLSHMNGTNTTTTSTTTTDSFTILPVPSNNNDDNKNKHYSAIVNDGGNDDDDDMA